MLPKSARLNLTKNFKWVSQGRKKETASLKLFFREGEENNQALVGVALSSKNFKKSYQRNKVKRTVFTALSEIYSDLSKKINLVIMPKQVVLNLDSQTIKKELLNVEGLYKSN